MHLWDPKYFRAKFGDQIVEVMADRSSDPRYELRSEFHKKRMLFSEFLDRIAACSESTDAYIVANNHFLEHPWASGLYDDIEAFPEYLDPDKVVGNTFVWFGAAGTVTPLHRDLMNIFMAQVRGRKQIGLISPNYSSEVYNEIGVFSEVDYEAPDLLKYPLLATVQRQDVELLPGEVLFLPVGWWHHVRSVELSIMVSFTNFVFPNKYRL